MLLVIRCFILRVKNELGEATFRALYTAFNSLEYCVLVNAAQSACLCKRGASFAFAWRHPPV